jgi:hypothetical protein
VYICISSRITIGIQNGKTVKGTITVLMSHSQFNRTRADT